MIHPEPEGPTIEAVVFDFGGVLIDWNPRHLYEQLIADPDDLDYFLSEVCPHLWHLQHDRGVPFAETLPARQSMFPDHAELIQAWGDRYQEMLGGEIPGTATIVDELRRKDVAVFGLTNLPGEVWPEVRERWPVTASLDRVLVSGEEGLIKPDPAIFELLLDRFDLTPERTVFVDDVAVNVNAAGGCGLHAIHFTSATQLRSDLRKLGLG